MQSSSTYLSYINQLKNNKQVYLNLRTYIKDAKFCMNNHTNNLNTAKTYFEAGYKEDNGTIFTGDLIINACESSESIYKRLEVLYNSINDEINTINRYISDYTNAYNRAVAQEREKARLKREADAKLGIVSK